jgi:integrase/recombinase XerC
VIGSLAIDEFVDALIGRGYARKTIVVYVTALRAAARSIDLDAVTATELRAYAESLPRTRSSKALLRSALRAYWDVSQRVDPPIAAVRVPTRARMRSRALDERSAARLARHAARRDDRKGLAVMIALYAGLRRAEISALRWDDIGPDGWVTLIGKGDVEGSIPLHPRLRRALAQYRTTPAGQDPEWVFPGREAGGPINPTTLWTWVRAVARDAGVAQVAPHILRHTCLTTALDGSRDLRAVQELARHARPETTAGYTRVHRDRLVETVAAIRYEGAR